MSLDLPPPCMELVDVLFGTAGVGLCLVAPDGTVLRANAEWLRWAGRAAEQVVGEPVVELVPGGREAALPVLARARAGERVTILPHPVRSGTRTTWWEGTVAPVALEGGTGVLQTVHPIRPPAGAERTAAGASAPLAARSGPDGRDLDEAIRRSEERARARAAELRAVLDAVPAAVFITRERDARRVEGNRFAEELLRVPEGANVSRSAPDGDPARGFRLMRNGVEVPSHELPVHVAAALGIALAGQEFDVVLADGGVRRVFGNAAPLLDERGRVQGAVGAFLDITERERAAAALRRTVELHRAVLAALPCGVVHHDADGLVISANEAAARLLGVSRDALTGRTALDARWRVIRPDGSPLAGAEQPVMVTLRSGAPQRGVEMGVHRPDGTLVWLSVDTEPVRLDGRTAGVVASFFDVTDLKRAERTLRDEDRRKNEFLAVLSHELRNPLAPIRHSLELLGRAPVGSDRSLRAREVIERQTAHLSRLVDDLLDVTRISRGKIELRRGVVDARAVVSGACDDRRFEFERLGVALRLEAAPEPVVVDADATRLAQVVGNLLHNAAKYTPRGGAVTVEVAASGGAAEIRVRDDGVGIAPELLTRVFEPFVQAERGLARTQGGLGLGLALVKGLVELHGGTVAARSEGPGRGAELVVSLPRVDGGAGVAAPAGPQVAAPARVVVIEDNADAALLLAELLEASGHRVAVANDGRSGIALARELRPDVVLCDLGLPDVDGYEVARTLRADAALAGVRLVAVTGYALPEDRARALAAGFDAHLAKPAPLEELIRLIAGAADLPAPPRTSPLRPGLCPL